MCYCLLKGNTKENLWTCFESWNYSCTFSNSISLPHRTPETRREQNHPVSQAHPSYSHTQQFPSVNVFNRTDT